MVDPSPKPQIRRSPAVGISLRCLPTSPFAPSKNSTVQYSVPPSRSMQPMTANSPVAAVAGGDDGNLLTVQLDCVLVILAEGFAPLGLSHAHWRAE